jgi:ABC-type nitrate/sulfonate/bicarbonate transport system substrate-binding protein
MRRRMQRTDGHTKVDNMKIAVPDLVSNSYFPALAALQLGYFEDEGLDLQLEHIFPINKSCEALRDGEVDFVAGSAHAPLAAFPNWQGAKLLAALAQGMYWLLVVRKDLKAERGDIQAVRGMRIAAAPFVELGLRAMLAEVGIDPDADVSIGLPEGRMKPGVSFGVAAADALADGEIDAFWANGMGAETAVSAGVGKILIDIRRGDEPKKAFNYTMPSLITTDALIERAPEAAAAAIRAIVRTQNALKADVDLATRVGKDLFPADKAELIVDVVRRDLPYYDATVREDFVLGMNEFMTGLGWLEGPVPYERVVAVEFNDLWA